MTTTTRRGFLGLVGTAALTAGCGSSGGGSAHRTTKLRYQGSAGAVTPAELAADLGYLGPVALEWVGDTTSGPQDIQAAATGQIDVGGLGGIIRDKALAAGGIKPLFTDYDLLGTFSAGTYVFRDDFLAKNPDTVRAFVSGVGKAVEWARATPRAEVVDRFTKIVKARGRNEDTTALRFFKSYGIAGTGGSIPAEEVSTWITRLEQQGP